MSAVTVESLHAELQHLQGLLHGEDHALADRLLDAHIAHVQDYLDAAGADYSREGIASLLDLQRATLAQMGQVRDTASAALRAQRHSNHAARAYSQAGSLR